MKSEQGSTNNSENSQISSGQSASSQNNKNQINDKMMIPQYWMKWIMLK